MVIAARVSLLLFFSAISLSAQAVGASISGTVKDDSGAVLPNVVVVIQNVETSAERKVVSDAGGRYSAPALAIGTYKVTAQRQGFTTQVRTGIRVDIGESSVVDLTLPVGVVKEVVVVEESPSPVTLSTEQTAG